MSKPVFTDKQNKRLETIKVSIESSLKANPNSKLMMDGIKLFLNRLKEAEEGK